VIAQEAIAHFILHLRQGSDYAVESITGVGRDQTIGVVSWLVVSPFNMLLAG